MSIFGSIVSKIFGHANAAPTPSAPTAPAAPPTAGAPPTASFNNPAPPSIAPGTSAPSPTAAAPAPSSAPTSSQSVDVAAVLTDLASKHAEKLDWKHSIVDLLKLLGLDSSLSARKELAQELHYSGSTDDSATMNMWLQKQVMQKLAENGGKVPDVFK